MNAPARLQAPVRLRPDQQLISDMIHERARVLDIGCAEGELLHHLVTTKQVVGRGMELSQSGVNTCVARGLSVIQGDADSDLDDYPDDAFDFVILSQTLNATRNPRDVLLALLRIGRWAVVSVPNMGFWRVRWQLFAEGRMPVTDALPHKWWDTPNIHLCTIKDFLETCEADGIGIEKALMINAAGTASDIGGRLRWANLFGREAVFLLRREAAGTR